MAVLTQTLSDSVLAQDSTQLVTNPSFENGAVWPVTGWETSLNAPGISVDTTSPDTGLQCIKLVIDGSNTNTGIRQTSGAAMTVLGNTNYRLRTRVKSSTAGQLQIQLADKYGNVGALFLQAGGTWTSASNYRSVNTTTSYTEVVIDFTTYVGQTTLIINDYKRSGNSTQAGRTFFIDNTTIEQLDTGMVRSVGKKLADSVTSSDSISFTKAIIRVFSESVTATDAVAKAVAKNMADAATISDAITNSQGYFRSLSDTAVTSDAISKQPGKRLSDSVSTADAIAKAYGLKLSDAVLVVDLFNRMMSYVLALHDTATATDDFSYTAIQAAVAIAAAVDVILDESNLNVSLEPTGTVVIMDKRNFDVPLE